MSTWTVRAASVLPALSTLQNWRVCTPSLEMATEVPVCWAPPSSRKSVAATPDSASAAVSATVTSVLFQLAGAVTVVTGGVRSMFTAGLLVAVVALPARSLTEADVVRPVPSPGIELSPGQAPSMPLSPAWSAHDQWTATVPLYQPAPLGLVVGVPLRVGAVLSMLIPLTVALDWLSALSTAVPVTDWPAPLPDAVVGPGQLLIPDSASEQVKDAVTEVLFQPLALAAGLREPVIVGDTLSSFTVTEPEPELPSRSVAFEVNVVPAVDPFCDAFAGVGPLPTPDPASAADQVMVTLLLSHPAAFAAGDSAAVTTGPVLSRAYDACADPLLPVHF